MTLDIANVINVNLPNNPSGLSDVNVNSLALFTTEEPSNIDPFRIYLNPTEVGDDYGTTSETFRLANNIFAQSFNVLSGKGRLVIIPMVGAISATNGIWESGDISANLAGLQAVADGDITITLNGNVIDLANLDFTLTSSFDDIATILQSKLVDVTVTAKATGLDFASKKVGSTSAVVVSQFAAGTGTDLSGASYFDTAAGSPTGGGIAQGETLIEAIARIGQSVQYIPLITNLKMEDSIITATASSIQGAGAKIWLHTFSSTEDLEPTTGICSIIKDASQSLTRCLYYSVFDDSSLMTASYTSRIFSVIFAGSNTTLTANLKDLVNIVGDPAVNQTILDKAKTAGVDTFGIYSQGSLAKIQSQGANRYVDEVYNEMWLKLAIEVADFNYLATTNTKISQTKTGMDGLKAAARKVMEQGVNNAMIGLGLEWNSSTLFGNVEDLKTNITENGFYIYSQPISQQSQTERDAREAPLVQIAFKQAGAIHSAVINIFQER